MRKVILSLHITLDGFVAGPNGELDWAVFDKEIDDALLPGTLDACDTALLGREMYQQFYSYWPSKQPPFFSAGEERFAAWINSVPKVVVSTTLDSVEWNETLLRDNVAEEVTRLKQLPGKDMLISGGVRLPQSMARLGLIDEYQLLITPVALGKGKSLFGELQDRTNLRLVETKSFASGPVWLRLEPKRA